MIVLMILLFSLLLFRGLGALGIEALETWVAATRWAMVTMLLFTASAHFNRFKHDMVRMVPDWIPWPMEMVYLTGVCEIAGAIGLLVPALRMAAGIALIAFFILIFPANVKSTREGLGVGSMRTMSLWLRAPMQVLFILLTGWVAFL